MTIKTTAATANDELVSLKHQVSDLVPVVKANHVQGNPKGTTQQNGQKMEINHSTEMAKKWKSNKQENLNILGD